MMTSVYVLHNFDPPSHDKIYVAVVKDGMVHKYWGRRGKRLNYSTDFDVRGLSDFIGKKMRDGYKDKMGDAIFRQDRALEIANMGMNDIAKLVDSNIAEPEPEEDKSWANQAVVCKNNKGFEKHFEKGVEYLCLEDSIEDSVGADLDILVLDIENQKIVVPRKKFRRM